MITPQPIASKPHAYNIIGLLGFDNPEPLFRKLHPIK
jgi:hypothetical protein